MITEHWNEETKIKENTTVIVIIAVAVAAGGHHCRWKSLEMRVQVLVATAVDVSLTLGIFKPARSLELGVVIVIVERCWVGQSSSMHQYTSKYHKTSQLTYQTRETAYKQPSQTQKLRRHAEHVHRHAWRCSTREYGCIHTRSHQYRPRITRLAQLECNAARRRVGQTREPCERVEKTCRRVSNIGPTCQWHRTTHGGTRKAQGPKGRAHTQSNADNSNRPANTLVSLNLPARGAEPRIGEPKARKPHERVERVHTCERCEGSQHQRWKGGVYLHSRRHGMTLEMGVVAVVVVAGSG